MLLFRLSRNPQNYMAIEREEKKKKNEDHAGSRALVSLKPQFRCPRSNCNFSGWVTQNTVTRMNLASRCEPIVCNSISTNRRIKRSTLVRFLFRFTAGNVEFSGQRMGFYDVLQPCIISTVSYIVLRCSYLRISQRATSLQWFLWRTIKVTSTDSWNKPSFITPPSPNNWR